MKIVAAGVVLAAVLVVGALSPAELAATPPLAFLALAALALEYKSPRHPLHGTASTALPIYFAAAVLPDAGPFWASLLAVLAVAVRSSRDPREEWTASAWEFFNDVLPCCAALLVLRVAGEVGPQVGGVGLIALGAALFIQRVLHSVLSHLWSGHIPEPERRAWTGLWLRSSSLLTLVSFLALPFTLLVASHPMTAFLVPIPSLLLAQGIGFLVDPDKDISHQRLSSQLERVQSTLKVQSQTANRVGEELKSRRQDLEFLEKLATSLSHQPTQKEVLHEVLWLMRQNAMGDSMVIFLEKDGKLVAADCKSAHEQKLIGFEPTETVEPIVGRAFRTHRTAVLRSEDQAQERVFDDEKQAVAVPIHRDGVIYVGRRADEGYSEDEVQRLSLLGQHTHLALKAARFSEAQQLALQREAEARAGVEALLKGVSAVLDLMLELIPVNEPLPLLRESGQRLPGLASHDFWAILAGEPGQSPTRYCVAGPSNHPAFDETALLALAEQVMASGQTRIFGNEPDFRPPATSVRSTLAAPMATEEGPVGVMVLCSCQPDAFDQQAESLLSILALQLGSHFWNAHLHAELGLTHQKLKNSQAQLVQSSKLAAVGQLAAGVAHELNTPLGAVMLALEGAMHALKKKPERAVSRLERALRAGTQLRDIVDKLLFYSRDAASEVQETNVNQVIQDTIQLVGRQLMIDQVELKVELGEVRPVMANQNELQQIVINLLTNARDALLDKQEGPRVITVASRTVGASVEFSVQDTGVGMDEETKARIFEPFFTTKLVGQGTGLGLSVALELLEGHSGEVRVQTAPGQGTLFVVRLPAA